METPANINLRSSGTPVSTAHGLKTASASTTFGPPGVPVSFTHGPIGAPASTSHGPPIDLEALSTSAHDMVGSGYH